MADAILTLNAGSSSIKFALYGATAPLPAAPEFVGQIEGIGAGGSAHLAIRNHDGGEMENRLLDLTGDGELSLHLSRLRADLAELASHPEPLGRQGLSVEL